MVGRRGGGEPARSGARARSLARARERPGRRGPARTSPGALTLALALLAAGAAPVPAQVVRGFVVDESLGRPLAGVHVELLDAAGTPRDDAFTGSDGSFTLRSPAAGGYRIRAEFLAADSVVVRRVDVAAEGAQVLIRMPMEPLELPPIVVEVGSWHRRLDRVGFYRREQRGFGHFFTEEEIEERRPFYTTDLLRMLPGVNVVPRRGGYGMDVSMRGGIRRCRPAVVLDGVPIELDFYTNLDDLVHPDEIRGMEVYASLGGAPLMYMIGNRCGAILIWTK